MTGTRVSFGGVDVNSDTTMGEVGDIGQWLRAEATNSNPSSSNSIDAGGNTDRCGICSAEVVNRGVLDCCNHWFCFACIDDWATVTNFCPLCKSRFRFITCLPLGYGDPNDPDCIGAGFAKRVDGAADDESNFPFSFPSYFIDEEAVVCLEGDACRVRAGMPSPEVDGALAADTSVACDLCDCWYHAGCVNFDAEQSSFYCPRCIPAPEKPKNSFTAVESGHRLSSEARASSLVGVLPPENEFSYGTTSVAIAVAEKGESAVSISMRRIPVQPSPKESSLPKRDDRKEVMWSPIREPVKASQSYGPMWSPIREPLNISKNYELWSSMPGPVNQDADNEALWSPTPGNADENDEELWSPTPESERILGSIFKEKPIAASVAPVKSHAQIDSTKQTNVCSEISTSVGSVAPAVGPHLRNGQLTTNGPDFASGKTESSTIISPTAKPTKEPDGFVSPVGVQKDERILVDSQIGLEQIKKGKRKPLQEDERRIDSKDLPEPPRKVARRSTKKSDAPEGRSLAVANDSSKQLPEHEIDDDNKTDYGQIKDLGSVVAVNSKVITEETANQGINNHHPGGSEEIRKQKTSEVETSAQDGIMDNVSDRRERSSTQRGVRTRIIMHRETDASDAVGSGLVDRIRQQMKSTAGYIKGEDLSKVEVSDDRFVAAFKAALLSSREKNKETKLPASNHGKSSLLAKVLNQKSQNKGSRDSLTRKLYAGGTGRWDRDWDIAFWKDRTPNSRRARQEGEDGNTSVEVTRKHAGGNKQPEEEDPIFSRIYVADTSLFPRNDDVQLLSAQVKIPLENGGTKPVNGSLVSLPIQKDSLQNATLNALIKDEFDLSKPRVELGGGVGSPSGSVRPQISAAPSTAPPKSTVLKTDVKKDKRQWALDVLARKTGRSLNGSANTAGSTKATGSLENGESQFGLLLRLPLEMRPLLQHNRHSKVSTAVRQVQLNRFVEQELRSANLAVIEKSPECEEAVNRAKSREEELYRKCNSKGVYVNLCVRSLKSGPPAKLKQEAEDAVQQALEATGLVDSPFSSPSHGQDDCIAASTSQEAEIPHMDCDDKGKKSSQEKGVDNVPETGDLSAGGDLEFDLENDSENGTASVAFPSSKLEAVTANPDSDNRMKKMTVVLSTTSNSAQEPSRAPSVGTPQLQEMVQDGAVIVDPLPTVEVLVQNEPQIRDDNIHKGLGPSSAVLPTSTDTDVISKTHSIESVSTSMPPSKDDLLLSSSNQARIAEGPEKTAENLPDVKKSQSSTPPITQNDDWMNSGKFADLDRRIENIRQSTSPSANREFEVPWNSNPASVEFGTQIDVHNPHNSVQKQVEIYVNQHLKPLYRSGVIKADQFRYAVSKTAAKVMEHHENATSAEFLITEGSKVRKLADQYLQNYAKRKVK